MLGAKLVFPGPHLHPDDLLDLMQARAADLALGVPTIWLSPDPARRDRTPAAGAAAGHAQPGRRRGRARGADPRLRKHGVWICRAGA
jgi:fatty-acyl-CoA synthase